MTRIGLMLSWSANIKKENKMKTRQIALTLLFLALFPISAFSGDLTVAVAANAQYAFEELKTVFEKESGITLKGVIGAAGKFTTQIENGAPFDVFLSADMDYPKTLEKEGLTVNSPKVYAYGSLVLWTLKEGLDLSKGLQTVNEPEVKKVAIASPKTAPYGKQSVNAFKHEGLYLNVEKKLVYGESIMQTNQFITSGAADLGITAKSIVMAPVMKDKGKWVELSHGIYEPIEQGAVILVHAKKEKMEEATKFFDFLFTAEAKEIFKKYGYELPGEEKHE